MFDIPRDEGYCIALWVSTLLFGVHIVIFCIFLSRFVWMSSQRSSDGSRPTIHVYLTGTAIAMFIVGATNNLVALQRVITAFWGQNSLSPADFFNETAITSNYVESVTWFLQVVLGDAFLTYRCWVIYTKRWWVLAVSGSLVLATFCMGVMLQWEFGRPHPNAVNYERTAALYRWEAPMIIISVALNLTLTTAIAWKIWWQYRQLGRVACHREAHYLRILWLIVESGMIVAIAQTLILVLGAIHNSGYQIVLHAVTPLIGIVFTSIILRVQKVSYENTAHTITTDAPPLDTLVIDSTLSGDDTARNRLLSFEPKRTRITDEIHHKPYDRHPEADLELSTLR